MRLAGIALVAALVTMSAAPTGATTEHQVRPGDSLWAIAQAFGVSIQAIVDSNGIADPDLITTGSIIVIPTPDASGADADVHVVRAGETLWSIAGKYGLGVGQLARQNDLSGTDPVIHPGQRLIIEPGASDGPEPDSGALPPVPTVQRHTVRPGETLWSIGGAYGVTVSALAVANGIVNADVVVVGSTLVVPKSSGSASANLPAELAADPTRLALMPLFDRWAAAYGVPAALLKALAWFESGWNNQRVSSAGAIGIGQVLPITADFVSDNLIGAKLDPRVPEENIRLSARFLRYLLDNTGDTRLAVAAYYQGLTATRQHGIFRSSQFYVEGIISLQTRFR
jgi:LysM repeat protein